MKRLLLSLSLLLGLSCLPAHADNSPAIGFSLNVTGLPPGGTTGQTIVNTGSGQGTWGTLGIGGGGTNAITQTGAVDSILGFAGISTGDIIYYNGTDWVRLPIGSSTNVLTVAGGLPTWAAASAGSGSVTSVTFTGDGVVDSATPSSAVTTSGTVTATLKTQAGNTVLGNFTGSAAAPTFGTVTVAAGGTGVTSFGGNSLVVTNVTGGLTTQFPPSNGVMYGQSGVPFATTATVQGGVLIGLLGGAPGFCTFGSAGQALVVGVGGTGIPGFGTTLVAGGGSGLSTITAHGVMVGEGTSAVAPTAAGTAGQVLTGNGATSDPTFQSGAYFFGGSGSDGATTVATGTVAARSYNATTFTTTASDTWQCAKCIISTTGAFTMANNSTIETDASLTGPTGYGLANAGGTAGGIGLAGGNGYGPAGGGGSAGSLATGAGGGGGAAGSGGASGTVTASAGYGGLVGSNQQFCNLDGSGGGGGEGGTGGTGGSGGGGSAHMIFISAGGFVAGSSTDQIFANGANGANDTTAGGGGGGGGAGSVEIYNGVGNMPVMTIQCEGGSGGTSSSAAVNSGGGGGGFIGGQSAGTVTSIATGITGGSGGTGGTGTGVAGQAGLVSLIASKVPTLPNLVYNHANGNSAMKMLAWISLAKKATRGEDTESAESHKFIWDSNITSQPFEFIASTYAKKGAYSDLCYALEHGGDENTSELCDDSVKPQIKAAFDQLKNAPLAKEFVDRPQTCDAVTLPNQA